MDVSNFDKLPRTQIKNCQPVYSNLKDALFLCIDLIFQNRNFFKSEEEIEIDNMPKGGGFTKPLKLSNDLAAIVGKEKASRAECVKLLWAYLKDKELQVLIDIWYS